MKKEYEGVNKLARTLQSRMKLVSQSPMTLDFGVINDDLSLTTNSFPVPIPVENYMVAGHLTYGPTGSLFFHTHKDYGEHEHGTTTTTDGHHSHNPTAVTTGTAGPYPLTASTTVTFTGQDGGHKHPKDKESYHQHKICLPEKMRWLNPGDRVIVGWVGNDVVVLDRIYSAKNNVGKSDDNDEQCDDKWVNG